MQNEALSEQFKLLADLSEIHGENTFKSGSYRTLAFAVEGAQFSVAELPVKELVSIRGIGDRGAKKIREIVEHGFLQQLKSLVESTPEGVLELLEVKGLGPKKIHTLWKTHNIDSLDSLAQVCENGTLAEYKGFGAKTAQKILESIRFRIASKGCMLYAGAGGFVEEMERELRRRAPDAWVEITGDYARELPVIHSLQWVTTASPEECTSLFLHFGYAYTLEEHCISGQAQNGLKLELISVTEDGFFAEALRRSSSEEYLASLGPAPLPAAQTEEGFWKALDREYTPAPFREPGLFLRYPFAKAELINNSDIKGIIHAHTTWSDGIHTVEEMATAAKESGFEYLVVSDHSRSAFYANGLVEERIRQQHREIDRLNEALSPFRIFKSIESDILNDGSLDYPPPVLASFDLVIASVHTNLDMPEEKSMQRLLAAIQNPYTTVLGHPTGRRLLRRPGYPLDIEKIIDACVEAGVVIEINAAPERLDLDWSHVTMAVDKGAMLSINPDAHSTADYGWLKYGVMAARKGLLPASRNLSSLSLHDFKDFIGKKRQSRLA